MPIFKPKTKPVDPVKDTPPQIGNEVTFADSFLYQKYALRPYNPAELYQKAGNYTIYDQMRVDDQISSMLSLKKYIALNAEWYIDCEDEDMRDFLTDCLTEYLDSPIERKMFEVLSALDYGFSVTEKLPEYRKTPYGDKIVWKCLKTRAPHSFEIQTDNKGNIDKLMQETERQGKIEIPMNKVILYSYNREFDNHYGTSELNKGVYTAWWSKQAIIKFWNIYLEKYASPVAVGTIGKGASKENRDAFQTIINNMSARTGITIPEGFAISLLHGAEGKGEFEAAIDKYNMMIARAFLVPDLMGLSGGQTGGGSYSLGTEQFKMFYMIINNIRNDIKRIINNELIKPLLFWNYGSDAWAEFKFNEIDSEKKTENMKLWLEAVKTGALPKNVEQINWFLDAIQAPEIEEEDIPEPVVPQEAPLETPQEMPEEVNEETPIDDANNDSDGNSDADNDVDDSEDNFSALETYAEGYWRPLTAYESKADYARITADEKAILEKFLPLGGEVFTLIINALLNDIRQRKIVEGRKIGVINKLTLKHTAKLERFFLELARDAYRAGSESIRSTSKFEFDTTIVNTEEEETSLLKEFAIFAALIEADEILKKSRVVLFDSIRAGAGVRETMSALEEALSPWNVINEMPEHRLTTVIRTQAAQSYNQARASEFDAMKDAIVGYFYSAILDDRTTALCRSLDSASKGIYKPADRDLINPPKHFNCRSTLIPVMQGQTIEKFATVPANITPGLNSTKAV